MAYIVTESCIKCKYTDCVDVCPVDCFREGPNMLVIDPDECIDCTLCVPECPVEAIFAEDDVPDAQKPFIALNRELAAKLAGDHRAQARARRCRRMGEGEGEKAAAGKKVTANGDSEQRSNLCAALALQKYFCRVNDHSSFEMSLADFFLGARNTVAS